MAEFMKKVTSRKFILALVGAIGGAATAFIGIGGTVGTIAAIIVSGTSLISYIVTEGIIDAKAVNQIVAIAEEVKKIVDEEKAKENTESANTEQIAQ